MRGELKALNMGDPAIAAFATTDGDQVLYVIHNFSAEAKTVTLPNTIASNVKLIADLSTQSQASALIDGNLTMQAYSSVVLK